MLSIVGYNLVSPGPSYFQNVNIPDVILDQLGIPGVEESRRQGDDEDDEYGGENRGKRKGRR